MFRFTIRDVLWLTVVVALGVGWLVNSERLHKTIRKLETDVAREKGKAVTFQVGTSEHPLRRGQKALIHVTEEGGAGVQFFNIPTQAVSPDEN